MNNSKHHLGPKHILVCVAVIALALGAVIAGAGAGFLLFGLLCPLMMGAMMWMMVGGMGGRGGNSS